MGRLNVHAALMKLLCNNSMGDTYVNCASGRLQINYNRLSEFKNAAYNININAGKCCLDLTFPSHAKLNLRSVGRIKYDSKFINSTVEDSNFLVDFISAKGNLNIKSQ